MLWGMGAGFVGGLVKVLVWGYETCPGGGFVCLGSEHREGDLTSAFAHGIVFGALGALYGGGIGALIRREDWETIFPHKPNGFVLRPIVKVLPGRYGKPDDVSGITRSFLSSATTRFTASPRY